MRLFGFIDDQITRKDILVWPPFDMDLVPGEFPNEFRIEVSIGPAVRFEASLMPVVAMEAA